MVNIMRNLTILIVITALLFAGCGFESRKAPPPQGKEVYASKNMGVYSSHSESFDKISSEQPISGVRFKHDTDGAFWVRLKQSSRPVSIMAARTPLEWNAPTQVSCQKFKSSDQTSIRCQGKGVIRLHPADNDRDNKTHVGIYSTPSETDKPMVTSEQGYASAKQKLSRWELNYAIYRAKSRIVRFAYEHEVPIQTAYDLVNTMIDIINEGWRKVAARLAAFKGVELYIEKQTGYECRMPDGMSYNSYASKLVVNGSASLGLAGCIRALLKFHTDRVLNE